MSETKTIKEDKTLIESVIDHSKEIVNLNNVVISFTDGLARMALCKYRALDTKCIRANIAEYRRRVRELKEHSANMFKAAYTSQFIVTTNEFHLSTAEMQAGFIFVYKKSHNNEIIRSVLFLSDVTPDLLDTIKEGEIREYTETLNETYLSHCKPVWTPSSTRDLYIESLTKRLK